MPRMTSMHVAAALAAAAGLSLYMMQGQSSTKTKVICAETSLEALENPESDRPYPSDALPGGRDVETPYGTIRVYEWGPEDGTKVLLMHGIGTPSLALASMAKELVSRGCRVMLFDYFGRGYSDTPADLPFDDRLYTTQILLVLATSSLSWTGDSAFHIVGYSLGGAIAASFAAYFPHLLQSVTAICPGGLIRSSHLSRKTRTLYSEGIFPEYVLQWLLKRRLQPAPGVGSADVPTEDGDGDVDFDTIVLGRNKKSVGDVMRWQLEGNAGLVRAYKSTITNAPIYGHHEKTWRKLSERLRERREGSTRPAGLPGGKICLILGDRDPVSIAEEWLEDATAVLGPEGFSFHVVTGGHEVAITKGQEVAAIMLESWSQTYERFAVTSP